MATGGFRNGLTASCQAGFDSFLGLRWAENLAHAKISATAGCGTGGLSAIRRGTDYIEARACVLLHRIQIHYTCGTSPAGSVFSESVASSVASQFHSLVDSESTFRIFNFNFSYHSFIHLIAEPPLLYIIDTSVLLRSRP